MRTMLRIHFMPQWFTLSDPAMEEALRDVPLFREFAGWNFETRPPDESTILCFRRLLEEHKLAEPILQTVNDMLRGQQPAARRGDPCLRRCGPPGCGQAA
jgi:IS5 family transposase